MPIWWSEPTSHHAFILSWVSIVITLIAAIIGIVGYFKLGDSLILIYGLENIVDFFSSAIVLWRFNLPPPQPTTTTANNNNNCQMDTTDEQQQNDALARREKRASIGVSIVLAILGFSGIITSIQELGKGAKEDEEDVLNTIILLSFFSLIIFSILAKFKFHYANQLKSSSLRKDGLCSAIGALLAFAMYFNAVLNMWWWFDPSMALICGLGAFSYGWYGMHKAYVKDGYPICSWRWWVYGGGKIQNQEIEHHQQQQQIDRGDGHGGDLELQQKEAGGAKPNHSMSSISMMTSKSGDEGMSDIVIT